MDKPNHLTSLLLTVAISGCSVPLTDYLPKQSLESRDAVEVRLQAKTSQDVSEITPRIMETAKSVVEKRLNSLGLSGVSVLVSANNQLVVQIPGLKDLSQAE